MQSDIKETTRAREFIIIKEHDPNWSLRSFCQLAWPCRCKQSTLVVSSVERDNATVFPLSSMTTNTFSLFRTRHGEEQHGRTFEKREEARVQNPKRACMALQLPIGDLIISIFSTAISVSSTVQHCFPYRSIIHISNPGSLCSHPLLHLLHQGHTVRIQMEIKP